MSIRLTIVLSVAAYVMLLAVAGAQPQPRPPGQPKGGPGGAPSQSGGIITSTTPEMTVRLLGEAGYEDVKTYTAKSGKTHVVGKTGEILVSVLHYCRDDKCEVLQFLATWDKIDGIDTAYANAWNNKKLFGRAAINENGGLDFDYIVHLGGGVPPQFITYTAKLFSGVLKGLGEFNPKN